MTKKVRYTYRLSENLFDEIAKESTQKSISMNSVITDILWKHYFLNKKEQNYE